MRHTTLATQDFRDQILRVAQKTIRGTEEFTTGVTVESIRTKAFPEDALPGEPTKLTFVVNVRLLDNPGQPIVRDVLVANQARQLIADASQVPVQLKKDSTGRFTVIGRSGQSSDDTKIDFFPIHDVDGKNLTFLYGLEFVLFQDLSIEIQTGLNAFRTSLGLPLFVALTQIYKDPILLLLGEGYFLGYLDVVSGVRGSSGGSLTCTQVTALMPWDDPRWLWALAPTGFGPNAVSWGVTETTTVCTP